MKNLIPANLEIFTHEKVILPNFTTRLIFNNIFYY
jgi:hypothetical protein